MYIEFFEKDAIENVCSCLTKVPEKVIFIGSNRKLMMQHSARYEEVFARRGMNISFSWKNVNKNNLQNIIDVLSSVVEENDDCIFDLTGGNELYLAAVGIVFERYKSTGRINMHRFTIANSTVVDCDLDGSTIAGSESDKPKLSVEENIRIYELFQKASDLNAVILKKDITRVQISKKRGSAEFFLIGENKSENMEQALCVIERVKSIEKMWVSVYVYSSVECDGYILDSADKGERIYDNSIANDIKKDPVGFLKSTDFSHNALDSGFTVRRIDSIECLVQKTLAADKTLDALFSKKEKEISVLILGMGDFGINFLKDALWLYQILGYSAKYTVFDMPKYENGRCLNIINRLGHEWPEIIDDTSKTRFVKNEVGNAVYDIQFFDGTDCFSSEFDKLFESGEAAERLRQTNIAVVCLGDDDKNIKAAIMLRSIFDRVNHISNKTLDSKETSRPLIYSLVYDEAKTNVLNKNRLTNGLTNHYGQPLQIDFIGDLESQYCYETIEEQKQREVVALQYHLEWIRAGALDDGRKNEEQLRVRLLESLSKYVDYEYFRRSSVARALQEEVVKKITNAADADMSCGTGGRSMLTSEHMRWNMYMRTIGYRYSEIRADRAKMHPDLISVDKLNTAERKKDTPRKGV